MPPQSLTSFWLALQFFSPTVVENNIDADGGGVIISMPRDKVTKSAVQALVDGTTGLSSAAQVEERDGNILVFIAGINKAALG